MALRWPRRRPRPTAAPPPSVAGNTWRAPSPHQPRRGSPIVTAAAMLSLPALWAAIRTVAAAVSTLPLLQPDGEPIDLADPAEFWARPSSTLTGQQLIDAIMWDLAIHGNAFVVPTAVDSRGRIISIEPIPAWAVWPQYRRGVPGDTWAVGVQIDGVPLAPWDVIHIRGPRMLGDDWGISPLKAMAASIGIQISERSHVASTFSDGLIATGYWGTDSPLDPVVAEQWAEQIADSVGGRGDGVLVLGSGLEWHQIALGHHDIELLAARQWSSAEAAQIVGVPPHLVGAADPGTSMTYSNVRDDMAVFDALHLERWRRAIGDEFAAHGLPVRLGASPLAEASLADRVATMERAVSAGLITRAAAAEMLGWPAPPDDPDQEMP